MTLPNATRLAGALLLAAAVGSGASAQSLPAAQPTAAKPVAAQSAAGQTAQQPAQTSPAQAPPQRAEIEFRNGLLTVSATGSSLNQILRDIARLTGMTITGGVNDERVFGSYGPDDTGAVLTALLNGTGSNMVLLENANNSPRQLVLTPRQGGPTPPNPNSYRDPEPPRRIPRYDMPPQQQIQQQPAPVQSAQPPDQPSLPQFPSPAQTAPDSSTTTQQSPNGVKTPQQIYEELMKMQQQQQPAATPPPHEHD